MSTLTKPPQALVDNMIEVISYYAQNPTNPPKAMFEMMLGSYPEWVDVSRGLYSCSPVAIGEKEITNLFTNRATWGAVLDAMVGKIPHINVTRTMLIFPYKTYLDVEIKISTFQDMIAGYAYLLASKGDLKAAHNLLSDAIPDASYRTYTTEWVYLCMFYFSKRWDDVLKKTRSCDNAIFLTAENRPQLDQNNEPIPFTAMRAASAMMGGVAMASLGKLQGAVTSLQGAIDMGMRSISAPAYYWMGLVQRCLGDDQAATIAFDEASKLGYSQQVQAALDNPNLTIARTTAENIQHRTKYWDPSTEPDITEVENAKRAKNAEQLLAEAESKLEAQIGMENVKTSVRQWKNAQIYNRERIADGKKVGTINYHMAFTGPPGTGKSTIAEIIAEICYGIGITKKPTAKVVTRKDIVGAYQGHSEENFKKIINESLGGVLFIDEAYALYNTEGGDTFGKTIVNELVGVMDAKRGELVVILAGYANDIAKLFEVNEGLSSRVAHEIEFTTYTPRELALIAKEKAIGDFYYEVEEGFIDVFTNLVEEIKDGTFNGRSNIDALGNGRFARSVIEKSIQIQADRLAGLRSTLPPEEYKKISDIISNEDVTTAFHQYVKEKLKIATG